MKKLYITTITITILLATQIVSANNTNLIEITPKSFNKIIHSNKPVFVKFWASWCGPCMKMAPKYKKASKYYVDKIIFGEINVDQYGKFAKSNGVKSIPTTILFIKGKEVDRFTGGLSLKQIRYWADEVAKGRYK